MQVLPFDRPTNYGEMLTKIGAFTFIEALLLTILVGWAAPPVDAVLGCLKVPVKVFSVEIPILYVVPAILIALAARIIRLHDKISDLFGVRSTFDVYRILVPLAGAIGVPVNESLRSLLEKERKRILQRTFYLYASFEDPKISRALVLGAIDVWTWYWVLCEFIVLLLVTAALLLFMQSFKAAGFVAISGWILTLLFSTCYRVCGAKADNQINEIVADPERVEALKRAFNELRA